MVQLLPSLRAYARFLARSPTDADDLVQEALARALGAAAQFQPGTNLRAWLFTILRNGFFEQVRRRRVEQTAVERSAEPAGHHAASPATQHDLMELDDLSRHLFLLSPLLRDALLLVGAEGFGYKEAAEVCGVPVGTMKARVSRARGQLARSLTTQTMMIQTLATRPRPPEPSPAGSRQAGDDDPPSSVSRIREATPKMAR